jgi:hypothetical protein
MTLKSCCTYSLFGELFSYLVSWSLFVLNFTYYSTISQRAEELIVEGLERQIITDDMKEWRNLLKWFASFKVPPNSQGFIRRNFQIIIMVGYIFIGLLPFFAFVIWFMRLPI